MIVDVLEKFLHEMNEDYNKKKKEHNKLKHGIIIKNKTKKFGRVLC